MKHVYDTNHLIKHHYNELEANTKQNLEYSLLNNSSLQNEYLELKDVISVLDSYGEKPTSKTVTSILVYAKISHVIR